MATLAEVASTTPRSHRGRLLITLAAIPAVVGAALLVARALQPSSPSASQTPNSDPAPPAIYARQVCSFSNADAKAALVQGGDGGQSIVVGGRTWWLFGDTLFLPESGKQIGANSIASSDSRGADGCPKLDYYAKDGVAAPFLEKDGSLTVWPSGAWPIDDHSFDFYTAYVYGSGPYAYWIGEVGLAQFDTTTMQTTILARKLWEGQRTAGNQVIGAMPIEIAADGLLRVALQTKAPGAGQSTAVHEILARVAPAKMADAAAYEYWDGARWTAAIETAQSMWDVPDPADPVQKLAAFENGASIAWNDALHKYVALVNTSFSTIGARTADRLEGPWSAAETWLDCTAFAQVRIPTCYSPSQHAEFAADGGGSIFATVSSIEPYSTVAFEFRPGVAVHEWRGAHDAVSYAAASPGSRWDDQGVAFYASATALDGFAPVYHWQHGDESQDALASPGDGFVRGDVAFYAAATATVSGSSVAYHPVFEWRNGASHLLSPKTTGLEQYGYTRGSPAFYAP